MRSTILKYAHQAKFFKCRNNSAKQIIVWLKNKQIFSNSYLVDFWFYWHLKLSGVHVQSQFYKGGQKWRQYSKSCAWWICVLLNHRILFCKTKSTSNKSNKKSTKSIFQNMSVFFFFFFFNITFYALTVTRVRFSNVELI